MQTYVNFAGTTAFHYLLITRSSLTVTAKLE